MRLRLMNVEAVLSREKAIRHHEVLLRQTELSWADATVPRARGQLGGQGNMAGAVHI